MNAESTPMCVIDSSVVYKWFSADSEANVQQALALLEAHSQGTRVLTAPAHMPAEVLNGLRYSNLAPSDLHIAAQGLEEARIVIVPLDAALLEAAIDLALPYDLTVHDALFAALAVRLGCELVTADRKQARIRECAVRLLP